MNGKVILLRNKCYADYDNEYWHIAIPVDMMLSALRETGQVSLYRCDGLDGYGHRKVRRIPYGDPRRSNGQFYEYLDPFSTQLSHNVHNGKEWVGALIHAEHWSLPDDIYSDFDLDDMNDQRENCHTLTIIECQPNERALRKALKAQGWSVVSKIPKKYLEQS